MSYLSNESAVIPPSFANVFPEQPAAQEPQEPQVASFAMKGSLWNPASGKYLNVFFLFIATIVRILDLH